MVKVKVCGITNVEDALSAVYFGADALGFVFYGKSRRFVDVNTAKVISDVVPPFVQKVGVFVNEDPSYVVDIMREVDLDIAQLHGSETVEDCNCIGRKNVIKAFRIKDSNSIDSIEPYIGNVSAILLDTYSESFGGTGKTFNWEIARSARERFNVPLILSGGLNPENVAKAIKVVRPYAVDVSSGVEASRGKKDMKKLKAFIEKAKCSSIPEFHHL